MLCSKVDQGSSTPNRVEERRKQRAKTKENSTSELLLLLKEMREEMRGRDELFKEELRWRDNHLDESNKKREHSDAALYQRDDE